MSGSCLTICDDKECLKLKKMMRSTGDQLYKLSLDAELIRENQKVINSLEKDYRKIVEEEREERMIRKAEMEVKKAENIQEYGMEIMNRPKKDWFISNKQKKSIREESKKEALGEDYVQKQQNQHGFRTKKIRKGLKRVNRRKSKN